MITYTLGINKLTINNQITPYRITVFAANKNFPEINKILSWATEQNINHFIPADNPDIFNSMFIMSFDMTDTIFALFKLTFDTRLIA